VAPAVHLIQAYDEYTVGFSESKYVLDAAGSARWAGGDRPLFNLVLVVDSQVAGQWKRTINRGAVHIEVAVYRPLDEPQLAALEAEVRRHADFLGLTGSLDCHGL
jgi:hypothetical protein